MKIDNFFDIDTEFNFEKEKQNFINNLDMLKSMSVQEQTLYKKWLEFNKDESTRQKFIRNYSKAEIPVISSPIIKVCISWVPS